MRRGSDVEDQRDEQALRLEAARGQALHHSLEQHPLVGDVLVDDGDPLRVDCDDERVPELTERDHRLDIGRR
jgi:hypothetical protein